MESGRYLTDNQIAKPKINPAQYALQVVFRLADGWSYCNSYGKLLMDYTCPNPSDKVGFGINFGTIALMDSGVENVLRPIVQEEQPHRTHHSIGKHVVSNLISLGTIFFTSEVILPALKDAMNNSAKDIVLENPFTSSAILGTLGMAVKGGAFLLLSNKDTLKFANIFRGDDSPDSLNKIQKVGQYVFRFVSDVAWLETARNALLYYGKSDVVEDARFMSLLMGADATRQLLKHFSYVASPFRSLIKQSSTPNEEKPALEDFEKDEFKRSNRQPLLDEELGQGELYLYEPPPKKTSTLWSIAKEVGSEAAKVIATGAVVYGMDQAFSNSNVGKDYAKKENESDYGTLYRMAHQLALFTAYVGIPVAVTYAKRAVNRFGFWKEKEKESFPSAVYSTEIDANAKPGVSSAVVLKR